MPPMNLLLVPNVANGARRIILQCVKRSPPPGLCTPLRARDILLPVANIGLRCNGALLRRGERMGKIVVMASVLVPAVVGGVTVTALAVGVGACLSSRSVVANLGSSTHTISCPNECAAVNGRSHAKEN